MKKGKIIAKKQVVLAVMVVALAVAVMLNMKFAANNGGFLLSGNSSNKTLGDTQFVAGTGSEEVIETGASSSYFNTSRKDRQKAREGAVELLQDVLSDVKIDEVAKTEAYSRLAELASRIEKEASIESLVKAKGFADSVAIIGDESVNIIVKSENLLASETLQIQDVVTSQHNIAIENIKIVTVK